MSSTFNSIQNRTFLGLVSLLLTMLIIFISLAQCTPQETPDMPQKQIEKSAGTITQPSVWQEESQDNHIDTNPTTEPIDLIDKSDMNPISTPDFDEENHDVPVLLDNATIVVDISEQTLYLYEGNKADADRLVKTYPISTSKYGIGNQTGTGKTPLGKHYIKNKIGDGAPERMIFKGRQSTGQLAVINQKGAGDLVTTRIMWLKGLEPGINSGRRIDSYQRYIYIHGTVEENKIGQPASHGCIRMYNNEVIDLFERVKEGTLVDIVR